MKYQEEKRSLNRLRINSDKITYISINMNYAIVHYTPPDGMKDAGVMIDFYYSSRNFFYKVLEIISDKKLQDFDRLVIIYLLNNGKKIGFKRMLDVMNIVTKHNININLVYHINKMKNKSHKNYLKSLL